MPALIRPAQSPTSTTLTRPWGSAGLRTCIDYGRATRQRSRLQRSLDLGSLRSAVPLADDVHRSRQRRAVRGGPHLKSGSFGTYRGGILLSLHVDRETPCLDNQRPAANRHTVDCPSALPCATWPTVLGDPPPAH